MNSATLGPSAPSLEDVCSCGGRIFRTEIESACCECGLVVDSSPVVSDVAFKVDNDGRDASSTARLPVRPMKTRFPGSGSPVWQLRLAERIAFHDDPRVRAAQHLVSVSNAIERIASMLSLPSLVVDDAKHEARTNPVSFRGVSNEVVAGAYVAFAARRARIAVSIRQLRRAVGRTRQLYRILRAIDRGAPPDRELVADHLSAVRPLREIGRTLRLDPAIVAEATRIVELVEKRPGGAGCVPRVLAAGAIRYMTRRPDQAPSTPTTREIVAAASCSEVSIRSTVKRLELILTKP